ncbi:hypothetical protein [Legionella longbeachae]|nr:hypothetical protein [Legionella longbeachae]EEZ95255.1 conserved hypothetical protein [Legionella longbeachae D-4968]
MFQWLKAWRQKKIIQCSHIAEAEWNDAFQHLSLLQRLNKKEK